MKFPTFLLGLSATLALTLTFATPTGCEGSQVRTSSTPAVLAQACNRPKGVTLTSFQTDGALKWAPEMGDGAVGIRFCDGDLYRVVEVTGLQAGLESNRQAGWAVDADNQVIFIDDLKGMIATTPAPFPRMVGLTGQCVLLPGSSCELGESSPGT